MKLKKQIAKELADLQRIPLFDPVFREAHGVKAVILSILAGIVVYCLAILYTSPWKTGYTEEERNLLILFVCIAGIVVAPCIMSYIVAFCLSFYDLIMWKVDMKLILTKEMKVLLVFSVMFLACGVVLTSQPKYDFWDIFCFVGSSAFFYFFVTNAWRRNYLEHQKEEQNQPD